MSDQPSLATFEQDLAEAPWALERHAPRIREIVTSAKAMSDWIALHAPSLHIAEDHAGVYSLCEHESCHAARGLLQQVEERV